MYLLGVEKDVEYFLDYELKVYMKKVDAGEACIVPTEHVPEELAKKLAATPKMAVEEHYWGWAV